VVIVLDTHTWLWWASDPGQLGAAARRAISRESSRGGAVVSSISAWEVAVKVAAGKLELDRDVHAWVAAACALPGLVVHPLQPVDAVESTLLPGPLHRDPADRIIIALARRLGAAIATRDEAIRQYPHVKTVW